MGAISSGIGLASGINTGALIEQLLAIEARPRQLVEQRVAVLEAQKAAFLDINARLLGLQSSATLLADPSQFNQRAATSSDSDVLTATADSSAAIGSYALNVARLVSTHQIITEGFADTDTSLFGATTLRFDSGQARLDNETQLADLNGQDGVQRGVIRITDRSGAVADIDLTRAVSLDDVLDGINTALNVNVVASLNRDGLLITDLTGQSASDLIVQDVGGTTTAVDLGIAGTSGGTDLISGTQVNTLTTDTFLRRLNDGLGVRILGGGQDDFSITDDSGTYNVSLDGAATLQDVADAIDTASASALSATVAADGVSLLLSGTGVITVAALNGSQAATDLGVEGTGSGGVLDGARVLASLNSKLLKNINGGLGVGFAPPGAPTILTSDTLLDDLFSGAGVDSNGNPTSIDIEVTDRNNTKYDIEVDTLTTVQDLIDAFDSATGGTVTLTIEGQALRATDNTGGTDKFKIKNKNGANVASDLGIDVDADVTTVLGVDTMPITSGPSASIQITNRAGGPTGIDLSSARSVSDVIDAINGAGAGVTASLNAAGDGLLLTDTTGSTAGNLIVVDIGGTLAADLGLDTGPGGVDADTLDGDDRDFRYISETTRLADLNGGTGIARGTFLITDSNGLSATVDLTQGDEVTLQDVIDEINSRPTLITASINATGDGLLLTDTAGGPVKLKIAEDGSSTAADLGILGEDDDADGVIDGSFEKAVVIDADDTLDDVLQKIGDADVPVFASIINDGSDINPFRLNLTSNYSGADGQFTFSDGGLGIDRSTLSQGEDAVVFFGGADPTTALLLTSNTNTLDDTIAGVNIDLLNTSDQPVQLTISRDTEAIVTDVGAAAESFNALIDTFEKYDTYDSETEERGLLLGDPTIAQIQRQLYSLINQRFTGVGGQFQFLSQIGFTIGSGARLQFDADKFRDALAEDPDGVSSLFTAAVDATPSPVTLPPGVSIPDTGPALEAVGFAQLLDELINAITDSIDGTLTRRTNNIDSQVELSNRRIDQLNELLGLKRERLEADFAAMEQAIATLQSQQSALLSLSLAAVNTPSVNNSFGGGGGLSA